MNDELLVQQQPQDLATDDQSYDPAVIQASVDQQRSLRMRYAIISHVTLVILLVSGGFAIAGKGPKWLRNKWVILSMIPTYLYSLHLATRETYWLGASDTQASDGGPPLL